MGYGWCGECRTKVALLVQSGRLRHHVRKGDRCGGSLCAPASVAVEMPKEWSK